MVQYIIFLTIDQMFFLHFSRFNYHSFSVNLKIIFKTNKKKFKKKQKQKKIAYCLISAIDT